MIVLFYKWATQNNKYFAKRGVPSLKPALFFGNSADFFTKKVDLIDFVKKLYNDFPDKKYVSNDHIFKKMIDNKTNERFKSKLRIHHFFFHQIGYLDSSISCDQLTCFAILNCTNKLQ